MRARRLLLTLALSLLLSTCASLPDRIEPAESHALADTGETLLGRSLRQPRADHPGLTGVHALPVGTEAFAARVLVARAAQRSLDLQYYVWHDDTVGSLLWQAAWEAAERGVRVRVLLDDENTSGMDALLAALDAHPRIEIRLFNPFANRSFRLGDFAVDFSRVNRRMHNKSFTADNQVAIVGGRNVGDEYYGAAVDVGFQDLDVIAVGQAVQDVSREFDLFWNSSSSWPVESLLASTPREDIGQLQARWENLRRQAHAKEYIEAARDSPIVSQLLQGQLALEWTTARVLHDDPSKVRFPPGRHDLQMLPRLIAALGNPQRELDMVSPYFVPGEDGAAGLMTLARRGVKVRVLTNSLAATDVGPVHAGYSRYRKKLLASGVRLYELKADAALLNSRQEDGRRKEAGAPSASALHAKTFAVDRQRIFVGSFNLDARSARLNTEMGMVIDSPALAAGLWDQFATGIPLNAYEVRLTGDGDRLEWIESRPPDHVRYATEPETGMLRRWWIELLSILPIESLL